MNKDNKDTKKPFRAILNCFKSETFALLGQVAC
jgi:hypothetical protein